MCFRSHGLQHRLGQAIIAITLVLVLDRLFYGLQLQYFLMQPRCRRVHLLGLWLWHANVVW